MVGRLGNKEVVEFKKETFTIYNNFVR